MWTIILYLIVIILAVVFAASAKGPETKPATLADVEAPTAEQGRAIPVVFGTVVLKSPNLVWYGDLKYIKRKR